MRTSPPAALTAKRSHSLPGTRSMSPKEQKITSGRAAMVTALSINSSGVTQTGQPGPWTRVISGGSSSSMPYLTMVCVWPPHISINVQGRVVTARIARRSVSAAAGSRYSSRNFISRSLPQFVQFVHPFEHSEHPPRLRLVDPGDGKPDVDQRVVADRDLGGRLQADALAD